MIIFNGEELTAAQIMKNKDALGGEIEALVTQNPERALEIVLSLCEAANEGGLTRAESSAFAALVCRFLLAKKNKSRLVALVTGNESIKAAVFGRLNTNKYSLIFLLKRLLRLNDPALTAELLTLIKNNPWCEKQAKPWSDRLSLEFVVTESLRAPEDYLCLTKENEEAVKSFLAED